MQKKETMRIKTVSMFFRRFKIAFEPVFSLAEKYVCTIRLSRRLSERAFKQMCTLITIIHENFDNGFDTRVNGYESTRSNGNKSMTAVHARVYRGNHNR